MCSIIATFRCASIRNISFLVRKPTICEIAPRRVAPESDRDYALQQERGALVLIVNTDMSTRPKTRGSVRIVLEIADFV